MKKNYSVVSKRKSTVATGVIKEGNGAIYVNSKLLSSFSNKLFRLIAMESLAISGGLDKKYNIYIKVSGGGGMSRSQAIKAVIAKALSHKEKSLKKKFLEYDRTLLVDDKRKTEPQKPYRSAARARKQTSYR